MNAETIAAVIAALVAIGAGFRKAKGIFRDDKAINTVVEMLRQEVQRLSEGNANLRNTLDSVQQENSILRTRLEEKDREHHNCQIALNQAMFKLESLNEYPKSASNDF